MVSQQVSKRSETCPDVAVFDWESLMIFDLTDMDQLQTRPARGTFFREDEDVGTFRILFLGFVLRGIRRYLTDPEN